MSIYHAPVITGPLPLCFEDNKAMPFYQTNLAGGRSNQGTLQCHITALLGVGCRMEARVPPVCTLWGRDTGKAGKGKAVMLSEGSKFAGK